MPPFFIGPILNEPSNTPASDRSGPWGHPSAPATRDDSASGRRCLEIGGCGFLDWFEYNEYPGFAPPNRRGGRARMRVDRPERARARPGLAAMRSAQPARRTARDQETP